MSSEEDKRGGGGTKSLACSFETSKSQPTAGESVKTVHENDFPEEAKGLTKNLVAAFESKPSASASASKEHVPSDFPVDFKGGLKGLKALFDSKPISVSVPKRKSSDSTADSKGAAKGIKSTFEPKPIASTTPNVKGTEKGTKPMVEYKPEADPSTPVTSATSQKDDFPQTSKGLTKGLKSAFETATVAATNDSTKPKEISSDTKGITKGLKSLFEASAHPGPLHSPEKSKPVKGIKSGYKSALESSTPLATVDKPKDMSLKESNAQSSMVSTPSGARSQHLEKIEGAGMIKETLETSKPAKVESQTRKVSSDDGTLKYGKKLEAGLADDKKPDDRTPTVTSRISSMKDQIILPGLARPPKKSISSRKSTDGAEDTLTSSRELSHLELSRPVIKAKRRVRTLSSLSAPGVFSPDNLTADADKREMTSSKSQKLIETEKKLDVEIDTSSRFPRAVPTKENTSTPAEKGSGLITRRRVVSESLPSLDEAKIAIVDGKKVNKWVLEWQKEMKDAQIKDQEKLVEKIIKEDESVHELVRDERQDAELSTGLVRKKGLVDMENLMMKGSEEGFSDEWIKSFASKLVGCEALFDDGEEESFNTEDELSLDFINQEGVFSKYNPHDPKRISMMKRLAKAITEFPEPPPIVVLNLFNNAFDDTFLFELLAGIKAGKLQHLRVLNLETNWFEESSLLALAECLTVDPCPFPCLRELRLENLKPAPSSAVEAALERALTINKTLVKLNLRIRNEGIKIKVMDRLARNRDEVRSKRLEQRRSRGDFSTAAPSTEMQKTILKIVHNDPEITELKCQGDRFFLMLKKGEILNLGKGLAKNSHVKVLQLNNVDLDKDFAFALAASLGENACLETIDLENNNIASEGVQALCDALRFNKTLKVLMLRNQGSQSVSTEAEAVILDAMSSNVTLIKLGVSFRMKDIGDKIDKILSKNKDLVRKSRATSAALAPARPSTVTKRGTGVPSEVELRIQRVISGTEEKDEKNAVFELVDERFFISLKEELKLQFFEALGKDTILKTLKFVGLEITDTMAEVLARSLCTNSTLEELNLERNAMTSKGLEAIISSLATNSTLKKVLLDHQKGGTLASAAETKIPEILDSNLTIQKLGISIRTIAVRDKLDRILRRNAANSKKVRAAPVAAI